MYEDLVNRGRIVKKRTEELMREKSRKNNLEMSQYECVQHVSFVWSKQCAIGTKR